jgi:hypothetical protein
MTDATARKALTQPVRRGQLPAFSCHRARVDGPERPSGRNASPSANTRSTIMSPAPSHPGPRTEIRLGARAHDHTLPDPHAPPHDTDRLLDEATQHR